MKRRQASKPQQRKSAEPVAAGMGDMFQYIALLPIIAKHAGTVQQVTNLLPALSALYDDCSVIPNKHAATIKKVQGLIPAVQAFVADALPQVIASSGVQPQS